MLDRAILWWLAEIFQRKRCEYPEKGADWTCLTSPKIIQANLQKRRNEQR
jgi:hypothetical protein